MDRVRTYVATLALTLGITPSVYGECTTAPITTYVKDAEIVLLGRVDAVRWNYVDANSVDGSIVNVTVKTLWKGSTPRQIELRQTMEVHQPNYAAGIGQDVVLFVRRLTPERPLHASITPAVTSGYTAESCSSRFAGEVDLSVFGRGRTPEN